MFTILKISQTINYGSPYHALKHKFILPSDLLEYLNVDKINFNRITAYHFLCDYIPPADQYLISKEHFLDKNPIYTHIATRFDPTVEVYKGELTGFVKNDIQNYISVMNSSEQKHLVHYYHKLHRKCDDGPVAADLVNGSLLLCDNIDICLRNPSLIKNILCRLTFLVEKAYIYYSQLAIKIYSKLVLELYEAGLFCICSKEEYKLLYEYLPGVLDENILNYNNLCYNISLMNVYEAGYYLGFPIHEFCPTLAQIKIAIEQLNILGIDNFCKKISETNTQQVDYIFSPGPQLHNYKKNSFFEKIMGYTPFDIVTYREGDHIFSFTRDEFFFLVEKRKNPWTNNTLPVSLLYNMIGRFEMSKEYGFPRSKPLNVALNNLQEQILSTSRTFIEFFQICHERYLVEDIKENDTDSDSDDEDVEQ